MLPMRQNSTCHSSEISSASLLGCLPILPHRLLSAPNIKPAKDFLGEIYDRIFLHSSLATLGTFNVFCTYRTLGRVEAESARYRLSIGFTQPTTHTARATPAKPSPRSPISTTTTTPCAKMPLPALGKHQKQTGKVAERSKAPR